MADGNKVLINLATGLEDQERVTIAFLVATAGQAAGKEVAIWMTKEAVRLANPGYATGVACDGCPPLERLMEQYAEAGGELLACPICVNTRGLADAELLPNARHMGATPLWEWVGDGATVFSY
jgi:predicted peroxiredoxin